MQYMTRLTERIRWIQILSFCHGCLVLLELLTGSTVLAKSRLESNGRYRHVTRIVLGVMTDRSHKYHNTIVVVSIPLVGKNPTRDPVIHQF
jgi:hypothetical protein